MTLVHVLFLVLGILLIVSGALDIPTRLWFWSVLHIVSGIVFILAAFGVLS
jgi:hypothetical protein